MTLAGQRIKEQGYAILEGVFTQEEITDARQDILNFVKTSPTLKNGGGVAIPDFIRHSKLSQVGQMKDHPRIHEALRDIFQGENYRFCSHNDIGMNRISGWHKDKLNGWVAKYQTVDIWSQPHGEKHEIVKVLTYLEDHHQDSDGLKLVPSSHLDPKISTKGWIQLRPHLGDVIIFDQRITHRGMEKQVRHPRILVSFGFGKNNLFTDNFEKGTVVRQNRQNRQLKR